MRPLKRILDLFIGIYYSLPVQMLIEQMRNHKSILIFWLFLFGVISGSALSDFGAQFLLLEPEMGHVAGVKSMFVLGTALGIFTLVFQMTMYILDGQKYFFLALERRPFVTFSLNNSLIPTLFWLWLIVEFWSLNLSVPNPDVQQLALETAAFVAGGAIISVLSVIYFFSLNKDVIRMLGKRVLSEFKNRRIILREARRAMGFDERVDVYLGKFFGIRKVPDEMQADFRHIVKVMNQHHTNALVLEAFLLVTLFVLWLIQDAAWLEIPAGAGFLLLFSFVMMLVGAITFWFRKIGLWIFILIGTGLYFLNYYEPFVGRYYAYGLNYDRPPAEYSMATLDSLSAPAVVREDSLQTIAALERWRRRYMASTGGEEPKLVVVATSGGGNRSAFWSLNCLQAADSVTDGRFGRQLRFMTGASGGMIGASYYRELMRQATDSSYIAYNGREPRRRVARDLMNPIILNLVVNSIFPNHRFDSDGQTYIKERGYAFEQQLIDNLDAFEDVRLGDYTDAVASGSLPQMVYTPAIVNDGRQLFISSLGVSYLAQSVHFPGEYHTEPAGVDFRRMFRAHGADSLHLTTAIRMNASFPGLLPYVELPSRPIVKLSDAGLLDNFGTYTAVRFIYTFREWISANTRGVVLVQLRDTRREWDIENIGRSTMLDRILGFIGRTYNSAGEGKDMLNDHLHIYAKDWLNAPLDIVDFQYFPDTTAQHATLSFHLTAREKRDIRQSLWRPANQAGFRLLRERLGRPEEALAEGDGRASAGAPNR